MTGRNIHLQINFMLNREIKNIVIFISTLFVSCGPMNEFDLPESICKDNFSSNISYTDLKSLAANQTVQIHDDLIIEGIVVSSDQAGNFFNTIHIQNTFSDHAQGLQIELELRDSYLLYPPGTKIYIRLKGLYLGQSKGVYKLGGAFTSFGSTVVGRLPTLAINDHIFISCEAITPPIANELTIESLKDLHLSTFIVLINLEFANNDLSLSFAEPEVETVRMLEDCAGRTIALINSGYSDFQSMLLPEANGSIKGVVVKDGNNLALKIRDTNDLLFDGIRCREQRVSSDRIFISEIADPENESKARFIELYNSGSESISLDGWALHRYTNDKTDVSSTIDFNGQVIESGGTLVISPSTEVFINIYGFPPDLAVGTNSPADSNGDDNLELVDPFGIVIDRFGIPGEDGSGTNHEFENGGAFRKVGIQKGNPEFTFEEWTIYNDSGMEGTIEQPLNAPGDFTPGTH